MDIVGPRTMEFCRRWGIADWVRDAPYPGDYPQDCVYVTGLSGYELGREPFPPARTKSARRKARRSASACRRTCSIPSCSASYARSRMSTCATTPSSSGSWKRQAGVRATLRDPRTGVTREMAADYLVGTDGGASFVRERPASQ